MKDWRQSQRGEQDYLGHGQLHICIVFSYNFSVHIYLLGTKLIYMYLHWTLLQTKMRG